MASMLNIVLSFIVIMAIVSIVSALMNKPKKKLEMTAKIENPTGLSKFKGKQV